MTLDRAPRLALIALALAPLAACGGGDDDDPFTVRSSVYAFGSDGLLDVQGVWALGRADEDGTPTAVDLNGDGDTLDEALVAIDVRNGGEVLAGAVARQVFTVGSNFYLVVDEAGNNDWNGNASDETVLLRWAPAEGDPAFVTTMLAGSDAIASAGRLWFISSQVPSSTDETALRFIDSASPETAQTVFSSPATTGQVVPEVFAEQDGLLAVTLDESVNGDQNADTDTNDARVMAFVEAGAVNPTLLTSSLAAPTSGQVLAMRLRDIDVWDVALLVSETAQNANLNGVLSQPVQCSSGADVDTSDDVLHLARFELGALSAFVNSELPGATNPLANRIVLTSDTVGLASQEGNYGPAPGCDLNGDTDFDDLILRWAPIDSPTTPEASLTLMRAIDPALPGGARGLTAISDRFVVAERQSVPAPTTPENLARLGWVDPVAGVAWEENFFDPEDFDLSDPIVVTSDWMAEPDGALNPVAVQEGPTGLNLNLGCQGVVKDTGSADLDDAIASWLVYSADRDAMILAGRGWAVQPNNSGLTIALSQVFFRVSEAEDGFDWTADGNLDDVLLFRTPLNACDPDNMFFLNTLPDTPAVVTDGAFGAAFLVDEALASTDVNGDGQVAGFALSTFRF